MKLGKLPMGALVFKHKPIMHRTGYLYFEIEPWSQGERVYLRIPSSGTLRAVRYWLNRIANWNDTGIVTHLTTTE